MKTTTATSLRKELFGALERAVHSIPIRIQYKKKNAVLLSYDQYEALRGGQKRRKRGKTLQPLISGKILKPLNEKAEIELVRYMGL